MYTVLVSDSSTKMNVIYESQKLLEAFKLAVKYLEEVNGGIRRIGSHGQISTDGKNLFKGKIYIVNERFPIANFWILSIDKNNFVRTEFVR